MPDKQINQSNLTEIINTEHQLLIDAPKDYGEFFAHALQSVKLLQSFVSGIKDEGWLFVSFLAHIRKHHTLAFLSTIRRHHVQTVMNLRQVLESGASAAYALANPEPKDFVTTTPEGLLDVPERLKKKRNKWLDENYPKGSEAIKSMKEQMQPSSHSNLIDTHRTFKYTNVGNLVQLETPFFDLENQFQIKGDLWSLTNIAMVLMDLFYGVNQKVNNITFSKNFVPEIQALDKEDKRLKEIMMKTRKFKRADKKAKLRDARLEEISAEMNKNKAHEEPSQ